MAKVRITIPQMAALWYDSDRVDREGDNEDLHKLCEVVRAADVVNAYYATHPPVKVHKDFIEHMENVLRDLTTRVEAHTTVAQPVEQPLVNRANRRKNRQEDS